MSAYLRGVGDHYHSGGGAPIVSDEEETMAQRKPQQSVRVSGPNGSADFDEVDNEAVRARVDEVCEAADALVRDVIGAKIGTADRALSSDSSDERV